MRVSETLLVSTQRILIAYWVRRAYFLMLVEVAHRPRGHSSISASVISSTRRTETPARYI